MPRLVSNGLDIYYERAGSGTPLLFISGSGADLRRRPNQFDAPIAQAFDLISYDQRGLGQTENPPGAFSMQQYADDAAGLLDQLGIDRIAVMGVSFGGMVAQELVLRHPHKVARLVLACTSSGGAGGASYPLHELQRLPPRERAERHLRLSDLRRDDQWVEAHPEKWQQLLQLSLANAEEDAGEGARKQLEARRFHDTYDRLDSIDVPVLLAAGRHDGIAPVANIEAMQARIKTCEVRWFEGGHLFLIQDKTAYPSIIDWLQA